MNIHFTDIHDFESLKTNSLFKIRVGSHLYKANSESSDIDYLYIYPTPQNHKNSINYLHHQLQYIEHTDVGNIDHNFVSLHNFLRNIITGDSTINYEILFTEEMKNSPLNFLYENRYKFRCYNILKSYIGLGMRDIKYFYKQKQEKQNSKLFHILRGIITANMIIENKYTNDFVTDEMIELKKYGCRNKESLDLFLSKSTEALNELRKKASNMLDITKEISYGLSVEFIYELDTWLMKFCNSDFYINKSKVDFDLGYFYKVLEQGDVIYG